MADFWGPGLDAELAYRHERLFTALRHTPYGDTHDQRGGEHDDLIAATTLTPEGASASSSPASTLTPAPLPSGALQPPHRRMRAARGWLLRGSESWHVAR